MGNVNYKNLKKANQSGFSLIELSFALIILGLILATFFSFYRPYVEQQKFEKTQKTVANAATEIRAYLDLNGHFPCPASMTADRTDTINYGYERNCSDTTTVAVNTCAAGNDYCVKESPRLFFDGVPGGDLRRVRVGALPFRTLNITEDESYDRYGSRLYYAVTESLARSSSEYNIDNGAISIVDTRGVELFDTNNDVVETGQTGLPEFIVFSVGPDREGGFTMNGNEISPCPTLNLAHYNDAYNCHRGAAMIARFVSKGAADGSQDIAMDDIMNLDAPQQSRTYGFRAGNAERTMTNPVGEDDND